MHESARHFFLVDLGRKITDRSRDDRQDSFITVRKRTSVLLHRLNPVGNGLWRDQRGTHAKLAQFSFPCDSLHSIKPLSFN